MSSGPDPGGPAGILGSRNVAAGAFLIALGALAFWMVSGLPRGTLRAFGPGMMPQGVAVLIAVTGAVILAAGLRGGHEPLERWNVRSILAVLGAVVAFGLTVRGFSLPGGVNIPGLGMLISVPLAMMIAGLADPETRWGESIVFAAVLTAFCIGLFKYALGLPIPLAPWLLGY